MQFLENFWSELLLLITGIGIIIQMILNYHLRKKEISHEIFHSSKMEALLRFYKAYSELRNKWRRVDENEIFEESFNSKSVSASLQASLENLQACILELEIYFYDFEIFQTFENIELNCLLLDRGLYRLLSNKWGETEHEKKTEFTRLVNSIEAENRIYFSKISRELSVK